MPIHPDGQRPILTVKEVTTEYILGLLLFGLLLFGLLWMEDISAKPLTKTLDLAQSPLIESLSQSAQWHALLQMRPHLPFNQLMSEVDDQDFFLSSNGASSPKQELVATIQAFLKRPITGQEDQSAQCRFPARFFFLQQQLELYKHTQLDKEPKNSDLLNFDIRLKQVNCPKFSEFYQLVRGEQLTLVFPASQLNSPSSMYGHTLLRIDRQQRHPLLNYSITFAAFTDLDDNPLVYSVNGLFGGYPGYFSMMPYHQKVKEYSRMESRDVWEYQLNIPQTEIDQLIRHAWELDQIRFDYYFFNENCAYRLLTLLDAANSHYQLTPAFRFKAIPLDTVKAFKQRGLIRSKHYRPSQTTKINHMLTHTSNSQHRLVKHIFTPVPKTAHPHQSQTPHIWDKPPFFASSSVPPDLISKKNISVNQAEAHINHAEALANHAEALANHAEALANHAKTLELAMLYQQELSRHDPGDPEFLQQQGLRLMKHRSELPITQVFPEIPTPSVSDDQGHPSNRIALAVGQSQDNNRSSAFTDIELRLAYHDFMDPLEGYQPGSTLEMGRFKFRAYEASTLRLQQASLINIESYSPRNILLKPWSWRVQVGFDRFLHAESDLFAYVNGGFGVAYDLGVQTRIYALLSPDIKLTTHAAASEFFDRSIALGVGPETGVIFSNKQYRLHLGIRYRFGITSFKDYEFLSNVTLSTSLGKQAQLAVSWRIQKTGYFNDLVQEAYVGIQGYF